MKFQDLTIQHVCIGEDSNWWHCTEQCLFGAGAVTQLVVQIIIWIKLLHRGQMKRIYSLLYITLLGINGVQIKHNIILSSVSDSKLMFLLLNFFLFILVYKFWRINSEMKN